MSTTNNNSTSNIINSWSLLNFVERFDDVFLNPYVNKTTGDPFKVLCFVDEDYEKGDPKRYTNVYLADDLSEITIEEIEKQEDNLRVVLLKSKRYKLCRVKEKGNRVTLSRRKKRS